MFQEKENNRTFIATSRFNKSSSFDDVDVQRRAWYRVGLGAF